MQGRKRANSATSGLTDPSMPNEPRLEVISTPFGHAHLLQRRIKDNVFEYRIDRKGFKAMLYVHGSSNWLEERNVVTDTSLENLPVEVAATRSLELPSELNLIDAINVSDSELNDDMNEGMDDKIYEYAESDLSTRDSEIQDLGSDGEEWNPEDDF